MLLTEFRDIILTADPNAKRYGGKGTDNYTVWGEYGASSLHADNNPFGKVWRIQVDRFTKLEDDPVVAAIDAALNRDDIAIRDYLIDIERENGRIAYIHHIWDCEVA